MRIVAGIVLWLGLAGSAWAAFPYDYDGAAPNDLQGKVEWMYAATPEPGNTLVNADPRELGGVRGASLVDRDPSVETAWQTTTGAFVPAAVEPVEGGETASVPAAGPAPNRSPCGRSMSRAIKVGPRPSGSGKTPRRRVWAL
jgi:hypothetical protein